MLGSQENAFNLAGVPYSDEAKSKVEKANVARKFGKSFIIESRPLPPLKVVSRDNVVRKEDKKYTDKCYLMIEKLSNTYSKYRQLNPCDINSIQIAYDHLSSFIIEWYGFLSINDPQYELARSLRYSKDPSKFMFISLGYDFNDLEGSYHELCEKEFNSMISDKEFYMFDVKAKEYFKVMLGEVFGSPPDLKSG